MRISKALELFLAEKKISGFTQKTLAFYHDSAGALVRFVQEAEGDVDVDALQEWIAPFFLAAQERGTTSTTRHTYWRGIKTFTRFLDAEGYTKEAIRLPKVASSQTTVRPLSTDQIRAVLSAFDTSTFRGLRNQTLVRLLFDTGLRLQEACGVTTLDVDLHEGYLLVRHGKGQKERSVPFGKKTRKALWAYLKQRERYARPQYKELFITEEGTPFSARGVQMMFKRLRKRVQMEGIRLSPHTARHSFALHYIEAGGDPFSLQRILGHTTQAMTARYVNMARSNVKSQHEKFSVGNDI